MKKVSTEELLAKASKWSKIGPPYHAFYRGKLEVMPKCAIRSLQDFSIWYTPGVAAACREIEKDKERQSWKCTLEGTDTDGNELVFVAAIDEDQRSVTCITVH